MTNRFRAYTDGASSGNPGPSGIGVVIERDSEVLAEFSSYIGETTNNVAEYLAFICGLEKVSELGIEDISFFSDSELMVRQVKGIYKVKNRKLKELHRRAMGRIESFRSFNIEYIDRSKNCIADGLARYAIRSFRSEVKTGSNSFGGRPDEQAGRPHFPKGG